LDACARRRKRRRRSTRAFAAQRTLNTLLGQTIFYLPREFANRKDWPHALFLVGIATEIRPDSAGAWYALAAMRARSGDGRGAVSALKRAKDTGRIEARWLEKDTDFDCRAPTLGLQGPARRAARPTGEEGLAPFGSEPEHGRVSFGR
jgi:hypothetical protein